MSLSEQTQFFKILCSCTKIERTFWLLKPVMWYNFLIESISIALMLPRLATLLLSPKD